MKGIVFDIKRFAVHDGPGIRTTVFLKGCPLQCWWCHNPESQNMQPEVCLKKISLDGMCYDKSEIIGKSMTVDEVIIELDKEAVFYDESDGGITIGGGEPLMQPKFLVQLLKSCKEKGYHTAVDTCGYAARSAIESILAYTDLYLYDLKHMDDHIHRKYTGTGNKLILENLRLLASQKRNVIIRIPLIPGVNDDEKHIGETISFLKSLGHIREVHLLPYHSMATQKYRRLEKEFKLPESGKYDQEKLKIIEKSFIENGFIVSIGG